MKIFEGMPVTQSVSPTYLNLSYLYNLTNIKNKKEPLKLDVTLEKILIFNFSNGLCHFDYFIILKY